MDLRKSAAGFEGEDTTSTGEGSPMLPMTWAREGRAENRQERTEIQTPKKSLAEQADVIEFKYPPESVGVCMKPLPGLTVPGGSDSRRS